MTQYRISFSWYDLSEEGVKHSTIIVDADDKQHAEDVLDEQMVASFDYTINSVDPV